MQALILAGGLGTRLRLAVADKPKPMASVGDSPFLEHLIVSLKEQGIRRFVFCVGYLYQQIQEHFGDGSRWGIDIKYSVEQEQLGTGGAVKHAEEYIQGTFLVLNGDTFLDADLSYVLQFHAKIKDELGNGDYLGTIALTTVRDASAFGSVRLSRDHTIVAFDEKSTAGTIDKYGSKLINAGVYVLEPEILEMIPSGKKVSIERRVFPSILEHGYLLGGCPLEGFFVDIGTPEGYHRFHSYVLEKHS